MLCASQQQLPASGQLRRDGLLQRSGHGRAKDDGGIMGCFIL
jgi:hypothetical protein